MSSSFKGGARCLCPMVAVSQPDEGRGHVRIETKAFVGPHGVLS